MRWKRFSTWLRFDLGASAEGELALRLLEEGAGEFAGRVAEESLAEVLRSRAAGFFSSSSLLLSDEESESDELS